MMAKARGGKITVKLQNEWRLDFAKNLFHKAGKPHGLAAAFVGGSVGRGLADEYSDLELCFVWHENRPAGHH